MVPTRSARATDSPGTTQRTVLAVLSSPGSADCLIAPFHNMMLVSPVTSDAQVAKLCSAFDEAANYYNLGLIHGTKPTVEEMADRFIERIKKAWRTWANCCRNTITWWQTTSTRTPPGWNRCKAPWKRGRAGAWVRKSTR